MTERANITNTGNQDFRNSRRDAELRDIRRAIVLLSGHLRKNAGLAISDVRDSALHLIDAMLEDAK